MSETTPMVYLTKEQDLMSAVQALGAAKKALWKVYSSFGATAEEAAGALRHVEACRARMLACCEALSEVGS